MNRWKLENLALNELYVFEINPNAQSSPYGGREVKWEFHPTEGFTGRRAANLPRQWSFSGVFRSQAQYDAFLVWVAKRRKIYLTDDRGDRFLLRLLTFQPQQQAGARSRHAPWRMTYTVDCSVYDILEAP